MAFDWAYFHARHGAHILSEWVDRLYTLTDSAYVDRPRKELEYTVGRALQSNLDVLAGNNYTRLNEFIDTITRMRLESGFALKDVQRAFELYRDIVTPLIFDQATPQEFFKAGRDLNQCLAYTIFRFSEQFQKMHEQQLLAHARQLEATVKARTAELRESERNYKTLVEEIDDGFLVIQDGHIVFVNDAFCEMHQCNCTDVLGQSLQTFIAPDYHSMSQQMLPETEPVEGTGQYFEYQRVSSDGCCYPTEIRFKTTHYRNRLSHIGLCRDITQRMRMEQKILDAERMATVGQITTSLSHEIRNPLSAVKLNLQILKQSGRLQGNDQRRVDISEREVIRLDRILQELLDFAKPMKLKRQPYQLNRLILSCTELLDVKTAEKAIDLQLKLDPTLPLVLIDPEKIQQAVMNLILNSIDASPNNGTIYLKSRYWQNGDQTEVAIDIRDQGPGVTAGLAEEIFKPFFTTKTKGTGLGLTNAHKIAQQHGGRIELDHNLPRGAAFYLILPIGDTNGKTPGD